MSSLKMVPETPPVSPLSLPESRQLLHVSPPKPTSALLQRSASQKRHLYDSLMEDDRTQVSCQDTPLEKMLEFRKKTDQNMETGNRQSRFEEEFSRHGPEDICGRSSKTSEEVEQDAQPRSPLPGFCASHPIVLIAERSQSSYNCWRTWDGESGTVEVSQQPGNSRRDHGLPQQIDRYQRKREASTDPISSAPTSKRSKQQIDRSSAKQYVDRATQYSESAPDGPQNPGNAPIFTQSNKGGDPHVRFNACTTLKIKYLKVEWTSPDGPWCRWACLDDVEIDDHQLVYL